MSEHTKEPWCVGNTTHENGEFIETAIMALEGRASVAVCLDFGFNNLGMRESNARRIVACVNRLAPFKTEHIEDFGYDLFADDRPKLLEAETRIYHLCKQRDELLAALKEAREALQFANDRPNGGISDTLWMMHRPETLFDFMDSAIAKAEAAK